MTTIVQLSDIHFGTETEAVLADLEKRLQALRPDILVCSGDITQRARRGQFQAFKQFLRRIPYGELVMVPGNHDVVPIYRPLKRWLKPYAHYERMRAEVRAATSAMRANVVVIGVNSCNPWHYKNGRLTSSTIAAVTSQLQRAPASALKFVFGHHPVDFVRDSDAENVVEGAERAVADWVRAGVDIIAGGHIHYQFWRPLAARYPKVGGDALVCQAGTAISSRIRAGKPNGFITYQVGAERSALEIVLWAWNEDSGAFEHQRFQPFASASAPAHQLSGYDQQGETPLALGSLVGPVQKRAGS